jgi:hypothetical protein
MDEEKEGAKDPNMLAFEAVQKADSAAVASDADTESAAVAVAVLTEVERERLQKSLQAELGQFTLVLLSRVHRLAAIVRQLVPRSTRW